MVETPRRVTAHIVSSQIFSDGVFVSEDNFSNYILFRGEKHFKLNILGAVVSKTEGNNVISFLIDDGFGQCEVRAFGNSSFYASLDVGCVVVVVGRPRKWQEHVYVNADVIREVSPLWAKHRKLILGENAPLQKKQEVVEEKTDTQHISLVEKVLSAIGDVDDGDGADIDDVIKKVGSSQCEDIIDKLIEQGDVFEFKPGRVKLL